MDRVKFYFNQLAEIAFPVTCVCCGCSTIYKRNYLCSWCLNERFEPAIVDKWELFPEVVWKQFALWKFDKGGYLQQLLHGLKYQNLRGVGEELGYILGNTFLSSVSDELVKIVAGNEPLLVPVPLHRHKQRKRGFNQARAIAMGISRAANWDIIDKGSLIREKNTKTQTGLNLSQRSDNLEKAFTILKGDFLENRLPVIVDDVFTTGATTFELAKTLSDAGAERVAILTVCKA